MQKVASLLAWAEGTSSSSLPVGTERSLFRIARFFVACMAEKLSYHIVKVEVELKSKQEKKNSFITTHPGRMKATAKTEITLHRKPECNYWVQIFPWTFLWYYENTIPGHSGRCMLLHVCPPTPLHIHMIKYFKIAMTSTKVRNSTGNISVPCIHPVGLDEASYLSLCDLACWKSYSSPWTAIVRFNHE